MKIIHITQQHKLPFGIKPTREIFEAVVVSQFKIANELKQHTNSPILVEGLCEDTELSHHLELSELIKTTLFPKGLPTEFKKLSDAQKEFLYNQGGAHTSLFLANISILYRSTRKEISDMIEKDSPNSAAHLKKSARETLAMDCAKKAALIHYPNMTHNQATVVIIFGNAHDFKPLCLELAYEHLLINTVEELNAPSLLEEKSEQRENSVAAHINPKKNNLNTLLCSNLKPAFFTPKLSPEHIVVPDKLQKIIHYSGILRDYRLQASLNLTRLVNLFHTKPWVVKALLHHNIRDGIYYKYISLEQLSQLTPEQTTAISQQVRNQDLKRTMILYSKKNAAATTLVKSKLTA